MLKPHDVLICLKVFLMKDRPWTIASLGVAIGLSPSEVHAGLKRLAVSRLYDAVQKKPITAAMQEFLIHGFKYAFPAEYSGLDRGLPTGVGGPVLSRKFNSMPGEIPVWPCEEGTTRGPVLKPLHPQVPKIAAQDLQWYSVVSLLDAIRSGKTREQREAAAVLEKFLSGTEVFGCESSKH